MTLATLATSEEFFSKSVHSKEKDEACLGFLVTEEGTEVRRAPLIYFQKIFFKKGFYRSKLARKLKFYAWIIIEGSKTLKKSQKMLKKATNLV